MSMKTMLGFRGCCAAAGAVAAVTAMNEANRPSHMHLVVLIVLSPCWSNAVCTAERHCRAEAKRGQHL